MPHLVIEYTKNLDSEADIAALCRGLADTLLAVLDAQGKPVFPTAGTRVLAYPAAHYAVADGTGDYAFIYLNLRMGRGRDEATKKRTGDMLFERAQVHLAGLFERRHIGLTLQIDEGPEVFDAKLNNMRPLFRPA